MNKKNILIITVVSVLMIIFLFIFVFIYNNNQYLTLNFTPIKNSVVTVQRQDGSSHIKFNGGEKKYIPRGLYKVILSGDSVKESSVYIRLGENPMIVSVPISLSDEEIDKIKKEKGHLVVSTFTNAFPKANNIYHIEADFFKDGSWAIVKLISKNDNSNDDTLYSILQEDASGRWRIIAKPSITVSKHEYPSIPQEVLDGTIPLLY